MKTKTKQKQMKLKNEACGTHIFYLPVRLSVRLSCCPAAFGLVSKNRKQKQKQKVQKKQRLSFFSRLAKRKINNNNEQRISRVFSEGNTSKGSTALSVCVCCVCVCNSCADSQAHWQRGAKWKNWPTLAERERKINDVVYDKA